MTWYKIVLTDRRDNENDLLSIDHRMASTSRGKEKPVLPNVGEAANQPLDVNYPKREFGKRKVVRKAFQAQWFAKWP